MERLAGICVSEDCVNSVLIWSPVKKDSIWIALRMLVYLYKKQLMIQYFPIKVVILHFSAHQVRHIVDCSLLVKAGMCFQTCSGFAVEKPSGTQTRPDVLC